MTPTELRERLAVEHDAIRDLVTTLERTAQRVLAGRADAVDDLRARTAQVVARLAAWHALEDRELYPLLCAGTRSGPRRTARMGAEQIARRTLLTRGMDESSTTRGIVQLAVVAEHVVDDVRGALAGRERDVFPTLDDS